MMDHDHFDCVDDLMFQALSEGVFPGAVVLGSVGDAIKYHRAYGWANLFTRQPMDEDTNFDLASLTKPLATTLAVLSLVGENFLELNQPVSTLLEGFDTEEKKHITIRQLLTHRSGFPAHRSYFEDLGGISSIEATGRVRRRLISEPLVQAPGENTIYSDLGFMILAWVVEARTGRLFPEWVTENIYAKAGIDSLFFPKIMAFRGMPRYAATELCPWRNRVLEGEVHDDNAYVMGGSSGHAGLFGTAYGIWKLLRILMQDAGRQGNELLLPFYLARRLFTKDADADRPLGMDTPTPGTSSCGGAFSLNAVGHLGFTGTSFWVDPATERIVILLSNRVHPSRRNWKIRPFRPLFHDAIMAYLNEEDS